MTTQQIYYKHGVVNRSESGRLGQTPAPATLTAFTLTTFTLPAGAEMRGLRLLSPLTLQVEYEEDGSTIFSDDEFLVYGDGETLVDALASYMTALREFYNLVARDAQFDPGSMVQLEHLERYFQRVP